MALGEFVSAEGGAINSVLCFTRIMSPWTGLHLEIFRYLCRIKREIIYLNTSDYKVDFSPRLLLIPQLGFYLPRFQSTNLWRHLQQKEKSEFVISTCSRSTILSPGSGSMRFQEWLPEGDSIVIFWLFGEGKKVQEKRLCFVKTREFEIRKWKEKKGRIKRKAHDVQLPCCF